MIWDVAKVDFLNKAQPAPPPTPPPTPTHTHTQIHTPSKVTIALMFFDDCNPTTLKGSMNTASAE